MNQGELTDGVVIAPSHGWLSPARALLLLLGAVLGGVLLSLALGSSPAHAAEGDGAPYPPNPLTAAARTVTGTVASTVSATVGTSIPAVEHTIQHAMDASAATVVRAVPVVAPVVAPAVTSVEATLAGTLTATTWTLQQLTAPAADALDPLALAGSGPSAVSAAGAGASAPRSGTGAGLDGTAISSDPPAAQGGSAGSGALPGSLVSSATSASPAAIGVLLAAFALMLLVARRRVIQNALPASPVFDTDTSPA